MPALRANKDSYISVTQGLPAAFGVEDGSGGRITTKRCTIETDANITTKPIRVLVVDDHPAVRQGLRFLLEQEGITVCAEAGNCADALARVEEHHPDLVLVDLSLGDEDGTTLIADLGERALPSLAYSIHEDGRHVEKALAAGARGYVTKREVHRVLVQAICEVTADRRFLSPRATIALAE